MRVESCRRLFDPLQCGLLVEHELCWVSLGCNGQIQETGSRESMDQGGWWYWIDDANYSPYAPLPKVLPNRQSPICTSFVLGVSLLVISQEARKLNSKIRVRSRSVRDQSEPAGRRPRRREVRRGWVEETDDENATMMSGQGKVEWQNQSRTDRMPAVDDGYCAQTAWETKGTE